MVESDNVFMLVRNDLFPFKLIFLLIMREESEISSSVDSF